MFKPNAKYYHWLPAYLEDGLDDAQKAQMQARLAVDPALASEAERLRRTMQQLREARAREHAPANATVPADLWPRLQRRLDPVPPPRPVRQIVWTAGVGATAALALAAALWLPLGQPRENAKIAKTNPPGQAAVPKPLASLPPVALPAPVAVHHSVQVAQAETPQAFSAPRPFAVPTPPASVASHELLPVVPPKRALTPVPPATLTRPAALKPVPTPAGQPTLMASRIDNGAMSNGAMTNSTMGNGAMTNSTMTNSTMTNSTISGDAVVNNRHAMLKAAPMPLSSPVVNAPAPAPAVIPPQAAAGAVSLSPALPRDQPQPIAPASPRFEFSMRRMGGVRKAVVPQTAAPTQDTLTAAPSLDTWQAALSTAVQSPLWGEDAGASQANQALMSVRMAGQLDTLRGRLEARRAQSPQDISTGRMLAAIYDFGFQGDLGRRERQRIVGLAGAGGEDWFALAQAEARAGNAQEARAAYRRALESPLPPSSFHAAIARQRE